jgi:3-phenylpropionate/cinnamic acid dioxygenase small subunit
MTSLQTLLDEREITRSLGRFARILDQKRWDELPEVFAEDLTFEYGSGVDQQGMDALRRQMRQFLDVCGGTQHLIGSIIIDVDGDQAVSRAYVQARHQRRDDPVGPIFDSTGEYVDRWERRPQGWRIVRRDASWFLHAGDPGVLQASQDDLG